MAAQGFWSDTATTGSSWATIKQMARKITKMIRGVFPVISIPEHKTFHYYTT
jgi:hypothetical protein